MTTVAEADKQLCEALHLHVPSGNYSRFVANAVYQLVEAMLNERRSPGPHCPHCGSVSLKVRGEGLLFCQRCHKEHASESRPPIEPATAGGAPSDEELERIEAAAVGGHGPAVTPYESLLRARRRALYEAGERAERERNKKADADMDRLQVFRDSVALHVFGMRSGCKGTPSAEVLEPFLALLDGEIAKANHPAPPPPVPAEKCPEPLPEVLPVGARSLKGWNVSGWRRLSPQHKSYVSPSGEFVWLAEDIDWSSVPPQATGTAEPGATGQGAEDVPLGTSDDDLAWLAGNGQPSVESVTRVLVRSIRWDEPPQGQMRRAARRIVKLFELYADAGAASLAPKLEAYERFVEWLCTLKDYAPLYTISQRLDQLRRELSAGGTRCPECGGRGRVWDNGDMTDCACKAQVK